MRLREMDDQVTYMEQLRAGDGPIVLINVFNVAPEDAKRLLEVWAEDAAFMKRQPGFVSTQLHRGTAGSSTFVNVAEWESAGALDARSPRQSSSGAWSSIRIASSRPRTFSRRWPFRVSEALGDDGIS
jgi:quinol monooxygenase YgiN